MRVTVFQVNDWFKEVAMGGVVNNSNRPVQGLGEISVGPHPLWLRGVFQAEGRPCLEYGLFSDIKFEWKRWYFQLSGWT